jgi:hypothetical protein
LNKRKTKKKDKSRVFTRRDSDTSDNDLVDIRKANGVLKGKNLRRVERFEETTVLNLSYQELGDPFQLKNFHRILSRLSAVRRLTLTDNFITSLRRFSFPDLNALFLQRNNIKSCKALPKAPKLEILDLSENLVTSSSGLGRYKALTTLRMDGCPISYAENYYASVQKVL